MNLKIIVLVGLLLGLGAALIFNKPKQTKPTPQKKVVVNTSITPTPVPLRMKSIFVPYWADLSEPADLEPYDRLIYFAVTVSKKGVVQDDPGFLKMEDFLKAAGTQKKWLGVRMTNTDTNLEILNSVGSWEQIASDTASIAQENKFDGVVLDLEMAALPSDGLRKRIVEFISKIHSELQSKNLPLAITIYGDTFYRKRPYDLKELEKNTEEVMVMAYDFHKSYGESGPNFQLSGRNTYGYDFGTMVRDFLLFIPKEKLTVIFGMYGYDWIVDEKKRPVKPAESVTLHQVRSKFLNGCEALNCVIRRDEKAYESEVNYIDEFANYHIVWFEDQVSVDKKSELMRINGISSIAYWAYGYF